MPHQAAATPSSAWFRPSVRNVRRPATRAIAAAAPPTAATMPRRSWIERLERWLWRVEQRRIDDYLSQSVDVVDLELRMRRLERRAVGGF